MSTLPGNRDNFSRLRNACSPPGKAPRTQGQAGQEEATEGPFLHPQPGWGDDPGHTLAV